MIDQVLSTVISQLNNYLKVAAGDAMDATAVLTDLVNQRGDISYAGENRLICTLFNVGQESMAQQIPTRDTGAKHPVLLNLDVLLSAYFSGNYKESLRQLAMAITFFQQMPLFDQKNTPAMPAGVDKVTAQLLNLSPETSSQLWLSFGARRMPFVALRFRVMAHPEYDQLEAVPAVTSVVR